MTKQTKKTTDLAVVDQDRIAALRQSCGANESGNAPWPPKLRVNRSPVNDAGEQLPMGKFVVTIDDVDHYLDDVDMIVMKKGTQFMWFKQGKKKGEKNTYMGCTMIEEGFAPEYKDSLGGTRLGREAGLEYDDMTDQQKEVKFHFHVLGIVDISQATDHKGEKLYDEVTAKWTGVSLQFKGKNSVSKQNELRKLKKKEEAYFDFVTHFTKPHKAGDIAGVPYYDFNFERGDAVSFTEEILDSIEATKNLIDNENKRIYGLYLKAQSEEGSSEEDSYTDLELEGEE